MRRFCRLFRDTHKTLRGIVSEVFNWHLLPDPQSEQALLDVNAKLVKLGSSIDLSRTSAHLTLFVSESFTTREIKELEDGCLGQEVPVYQEITLSSSFSAPMFVPGDYVIAHAVDPTPFLGFGDRLRAAASLLKGRSTATRTPNLPPHVTVGRIIFGAPSSKSPTLSDGPLHLSFNAFGLGVQGINGTIVEQLLRIEFTSPK